MAFTRRKVIMVGLLATVLSGCGFGRKRDDIETITAVMQEAVRNSGPYVSGEVEYVSEFTAGKTISGGLTLAAENDSELVSAYETVLRDLNEALEPYCSTVKDARVNVIVRAEADRSLSAAAEDAVPPADGSAGHPKVSDLGKHFGTGCQG